MPPKGTVQAHKVEAIPHGHANKLMLQALPPDELSANLVRGIACQVPVVGWQPAVDPAVDCEYGSTGVPVGETESGGPLGKSG